ncbi:MAG TPA: sulfurtransferase TusA family protein [Alphaproteobacteria bacterium]|nr:sulfurtransferase TusA family protein [Alphaproteobacteria bacterium]
MAGTRKADEEIIDALGLKCPLPVLLARRALNAASPGAIIVLYADDPLAQIDLPVFCEREGHRLLGVELSVSRQIFRIRKA